MHLLLFRYLNVVEIVSFFYYRTKLDYSSNYARIFCFILNVLKSGGVAAVILILQKFIIQFVRE